MVTFVIVGVVLIVGMTYYLSRRSNQGAIDRLRFVSPDDAAKLDLMRAEQAARTQSAGGGMMGSPF
jgi:hypothetical protein